MNVDDERLMAYLDGELDAVERARVAQALEADEALRRRLDAQSRLRERLAARYDPIGQEEVPDRFRRMLEPQVVDLAAARLRRTLARPTWQGLAALAATLVLGLLLGFQLARDGGPVRSRSGVLYASGELASQLDTQLASAPAGGPMRVGVSFARRDGSYCRTFEGDALSGLACRSGKGWRLVVTAPGSHASQAEYRQAASGNALVLQAAQAMMAGEPLDAEGERRARASGWRRAVD